MHHVRLLLLLVLPLLPGLAWADERRDEQVKALLRDVEQAVQRARPSVASILVSRSEEYAQAPYWGMPSTEPSLGHLGRFDRVAALAKIPATAAHRERILATLQAHDLSNPQVVPESYGSGFVVGPDLVLSNAHVVRNATKIYVRLPGEGRGSWADVHASDPRSDLAVLRLLDRVPDLQPIRLGRGEEVERGQVLLTLANPWTRTFRPVEPVTSWGLVTRQRIPSPERTSELERSKSLHQHGTLFQIDARVMPGCSGGVVLNLDGQAVGLTTALAAIRDADSSGILAVPFEASTRRIIEVLMRGEEVEYGFLGVMLDPGDPAGARVRTISPSSPASRAGLRTGDLITRINDQPIQTNHDLFLAIGMSLAGNPARLEISRVREGQRRTATVTLAKFYVPGPVIASRQPPARGGLRVDYVSLLCQRGPFFGWGAGPPEGVIVREVIPGSPADRARLQPDKIITHVNGRAVTSPTDYYREAERARERLDLTILDSESRPERVTLDLK